MGTGVKEKYSVAINGLGYILKGAPNRPAYLRGVVASQIERLAISDLAYSDFAGTGLFFVAQTDWSAGMKNDPKWVDDAHYYQAENIDAFSNIGEVKLLKKPITEDTSINFAAAEIDHVTSSCIFSTGGNNQIAIGDKGNNTGEQEVNIRNSSISTTTLNYSDGTIIFDMVYFKDALYVGANGATNVLQRYSSTAGKSVSLIDLAVGVTCSNPRALTATTAKIYVVHYDSGNSNWEIWDSATGNHEGWAHVLDFSGDETPENMASDGTDVFILTSMGQKELRFYKYDVTNSLLIHLYSWNKKINTSGYRRKMIYHENGKIYFKLTPYDASEPEEIWSYNTINEEMEQRYIDERGLFTATAGLVIMNRKLYVGDITIDDDDTNLLVYGGAEDNGETTYIQYLGDYFGTIYSIKEKGTDGKVWKHASTYYLSGNFIFSGMSPITAIDKLFDSVTVIFDGFDTGESIKVEYSIDNMSNWTALKTITPTTEGTGTKKVWKIPGNIVFTRIWFRVTLGSDGTSTPTLRDFIMAYKPMPDYKNRWNMRLNLSDNFRLLNNQNEQRTGNDLLGELWNQKVAKQKVLFEDIDYVECSLVSGMTATGTSALVDNTSRLPRQGRIRAVSGSVAEEMTYTSAAPNKLLGISRGKRGTAARAYSAAQVLKNDYDVYIEDIKSEIGFIDENKTESVAQVMLIES